MTEGTGSEQGTGGPQGGQGPASERGGGQRCDFCGEVVPRVRRVALDQDYERLQTRHAVRYACPSCSEAKERSRLGLEPPRRS
jgi:hypothetical protein